MSKNRFGTFSCVMMTVAALVTCNGVLAQDEARDDAPGESATAAVKMQVQLGAPFNDNAVLQRDMPLPVWGWCTPGATVTVNFADQSKTATSAEDGKWTLKLDPLAASFEPRSMTIKTSEGKEQILKNILVGEVWMASGQSNMQWMASKSSAAKLKVESRNGVAPIREFEVTSVYAQLHPIEKATGSWKDGNIGDYSAIALAFANTLYQQLDVPVGILNCSFSQTAIQAWVPTIGYRDGTDEYTQAIYQRVLQSDPSTPQHKAAWDKYYAEVEQTIKDNTARVANGETAQAIPTRVPGNLNDNRDATWMYNGRLSPVVPYAIRGAIWNQGYANMGEGLVYYNNLHSLIRGWRLVWDRPELPVYFHQFYTPGDGTPEPSIGSTAEMRLGTYMARDIPNAGMASQIDIGGAIHYRSKTVPGFRLALHALKNQYPDITIKQMHDAPQFVTGVGSPAKDLVAQGPMFKSYVVDGKNLTVSFDNAQGGLIVGESKTKSESKAGPGFAEATIIPNGEAQLKLFYLAGADRVWHPATAKIQGDTVVLPADGVDAPKGVSYATGGVAWQVNLYNQSHLPTTPFISYDNQPVTSKTWPDPALKIAGKQIDPNSVGLSYEWRKMPLLSTQFRDNAVLQAGQDITIWGSAQNGEGEPAPANSRIEFSFNGIEKTIPIDTKGPNLVALAPEETRNAREGLEWRVTVPAMPASDEPKTLTVRFFIGDKVVVERVCKNIVVGDVWYVACPPLGLPAPKNTAKGEPQPVVGNIRVLARNAKRSAHDTPSRYSISVSQDPDNRFASEWKPPTGFAAMLGEKIHAKTGKPVGIIFMETVGGKGATNPPLKSWIAYPSLKTAPSLMDDYKALASLAPGNEYYDANVQRYLAAWKTYWGEYIPEMIATRSVPDESKWGAYPKIAGGVATDATKTYNVMTHSFTPTGVKAIVFIASPEMVKDDQGAHFGEQMTALADCWLTRFASPTARFFYTLPDASLAPSITPADPTRTTAVPIPQWPTADKQGDQLQAMIELIVKESYP